MKKHLKKLLIMLLTAVCVGCLAFGLVACGGNNNNTDDGPTALEAPVLDISGTVLSWNTVENATGYQIWENSVRKADVVETSYNIPATTLAVPGTYRYTVKAVSSDPDYTDSPMSNVQTYVVVLPATELSAPSIYLDDYSGILSWDAVDHADGYYVYENGTRVNNVRLTTTSYTIGKKSAAGEYEYTVNAISYDSRYSESPMSNAVKLTVEEIAAPEITIDADSAVISWNAVNNADSYAVYADGIRITTTFDTFYEMTQTPGEHKFYVEAISNSIKYAPGKSETTTFAVPLIATIGFEVPADFNAQNVTAVLCGGEVDKEVAVTDFANTVRMVASAGAAQNYTVKLKGLPEEYVSTWAHVGNDNRTGMITVLKKGESELTLGSQTLTQTLTVVDEVLSASAQYIFVAGTTEEGDGIHSVELKASDYTNKSMTVSVNGVKVVDTSYGLYTGSFTAEEGEALIVAFEFSKEAAENTTSEQVTFEFSIVAKEIKQYVNVLDAEYNPEAQPGSEQAIKQQAAMNYVTGSCNRYINVDKDTTLSFLFLTGTVGDRTVTLTINGESQEGIGGGQYTFNVKAGTDIKIEIKVNGISFSGQDVMTFWVYPVV